MTSAKRRLVVSLVLLLVVCISNHGAMAEPYRLKLEPALEWYNETTPPVPSLFFKVVDPPSSPACAEQSFPMEPGRMNETVCGGDFSVDLSLYDGIEFTFEAPEGKEIWIQSVEDPGRVELEFQGKAASCGTPTPPYLQLSGENITINFAGSDVDTLEANYNSANSFVSLGQCAMGCSSCDIFTRIQLGTSVPASSFSGKVTRISWNVTYDPSVFSGLSGALDYRYDTLGYCWIRTPYANAIIDAPTTSPTSATTGTPSKAPTIAASASPTATPTSATSTGSPSKSPTAAPTATPTTTAGSTAGSTTQSPTASPTAASGNTSDAIVFAAPSFILMSLLITAVLSLIFE